MGQTRGMGGDAENSGDPTLLTGAEIVGEPSRLSGGAVVNVTPPGASVGDIRYHVVYGGVVL